jgi:tryptophan-rich sensory protein
VRDGGDVVIGPAVAAAVMCIAGAWAEALLAGPGVRERLRQLRQPRLSPPFGVWMIVGGLYYGICFALLFRLFRADWRGGVGALALVFVVLLMSTNALWNLYFFRRRDLRGSFWVSVVYAVVAVGLTATLTRLGDGSLWVFMPYQIYLVYGTYYGYATWRLNSH